MPVDHHTSRVRAISFGIAAGVVAIDAIVKAWVTQAIPLHSARQIIPGIFDIVHYENRGAAFSSSGVAPSPAIFALMVTCSIAATLVVCVLLWRTGAVAPGSVGLALVLGGAIGNLWERIAYGRVVDMFDFALAEHHWPAFNVADSAIVVGTGLIALAMFFRPDDFRRPGHPS